MPTLKKTKSRRWPVLYTIGYEKQSLKGLVDQLSAQDIHIVFDVREHAWSQRPEFVKGRLQSALADCGIEYIHDKGLGNPKSIRELSKTREAGLKKFARYLEAHTANLDSLDRAITDAHAASKNICLFCYERDPQDCHRSVLIDQLKKRRTRLRIVHFHIEQRTSLET